MQQIKFCDIAKFAIVPNSPLFIEKIKFSVSVVKYMLEGIEKTTHTHTHTQSYSHNGHKNTRKNTIVVFFLVPLEDLNFSNLSATLAKLYNAGLLIIALCEWS